MTIPSRPAPPPPQKYSQGNNKAACQNDGGQNQIVKLPPPSSNSLSTTKKSASITRHFPAAKTRYEPATNWNGSPFDTQPNRISNENRKVPPPRPPPPRVANATNVKKSGAPPHSVNVLSNLFGRRKPKATTQATTSLSLSSKNPQVNPLFPNNAFQSNFVTTAQSKNIAEAELITFDSPPSSPTFTQKSNSDCVSVDSFSSDSNFSSPHNGSVSQPESGFEDDFSTTYATNSPVDPWETLEAFSGENIYSGSASSVSAPVRNLNIVTARIKNNNDNQLCNGRNLLPPTPILSMPTIIKPKMSQKQKAPKPPSLLKTNESFGNFGSTFDSVNEYPQMPRNAPPPLPCDKANTVSILDVINGTADALNLYIGDDDSSSPPYGIALYNFEGVEDGDLSFNENDKIYLLEKMNEEWLKGRDRRGCEGIFPLNYIDIKVPLEGQSGATYSTQEKSIDVKNAIQARSLYTFVAEHPDDLSLNENDIVTILYRINEDWLYGKVGCQEGQFPANFLEYIPNDIPML